MFIPFFSEIIFLDGNMSHYFYFCMFLVISLSSHARANPLARSPGQVKNRFRLVKIIKEFV
jgi:hypothetical protein